MSRLTAGIARATIHTMGVIAVVIVYTIDGNGNGNNHKSSTV